jgi:Protein of unknown function (DUF2393)
LNLSGFEFALKGRGFSRWRPTFYPNSRQIDNQESTAYNPVMGSTGQPSFGQPTTGQQNPLAEERDSSRLIIMIAVAGVIAIMLGLAFLMRESPKPPKPPSPYLASLKISDVKMSTADNFIGATVSYVEGTVTNSGTKTVTHATVEVVFKDDIGQLAQRDELPLRVLKTTGPYPEAVDLEAAPLAPGQTQSFRLTYDSISAQWNHQYPEVRVTDVTVK